MNKTKLRVAIVGLGKMGLVHTGILNVLPDVQVVAICEKSLLIRKFVKKVFKGIEIVDDVERLVGCDLDAVYVTTPIPSHFSVSRTVLAERIAPNLFVEKTLTQDYDNSKELSELANKSAGTNMVGYLRRFYVTFNKAKDLLNKEAIGKVGSFKAYAYSSDFSEVKRGSKTAASRGGVLRDLGCHAIDLTLWLFDDLKVSHVSPLVDGNVSGDSANFEVENPELAGEIDVSWRMPNYRLPEVGFSILGSKGELTVNDDQVRLSVRNEKPFEWYRHDLDDSVPFWLGLPEYYREDSYFVKSIIESNRAEPDFYAASQVDRIIAEVEKTDGGGRD